VTAAVPVDVVYAQVGSIQYEMPMRGQRSFGVYSSSLGEVPDRRITSRSFDWRVLQ
jgi:hypothetical protein